MASSGRQGADSPQGRVLCVSSNFPRWAGDSTTPFVLHLAKDLQALGWEVDVLAPHAEQGTAKEETMDGVRVERFHYLWPQRAQTVCYHGGALINLRRNKTNFLKLPALVAAEWAAVASRLATRRYDVLHSHWILPQGFTGALAAAPLRVPHVLTVHGSDVFALKGRILRGFKRFSLRRADAVTVNSSATEAVTKEIAPGLQTLHRIPMGVAAHPIAKDDAHVEELRRRHGLEDGPILVFVGRVVAEKGVGELLQAVSRLKNTLPGTTLIVVGDGQQRAEFELMARSLDIGDRTHFVGWIPPSEVPKYLAAGDVFVGPSRFEAQGLTFIEAMMASTPVVATGVGGIIDSVEHERTGLLVDVAAPEQIARAVERLVGDAKLRTLIIEAARSRAISSFSRASSAERFSRLFSDLVGHRGR